VNGALPGLNKRAAERRAAIEGGGAGAARPRLPLAIRLGAAGGPADAVSVDAQYVGLPLGETSAGAPGC